MKASIALPEQRIILADVPEAIFRQLSAFDEQRILARGENEIIAEFAGQIGRYRWTTRERVRFDPDRHRITFEQLRPPFFTVRTAVETFDLMPNAEGGTTLIVRGTLTPRLGPFGWLMTRWVVRPCWERIEMKHLDRLSEGYGPS